MTTAATLASPMAVLGRLSSLADETRARILLLLEGSELTVSEICAVVQLPQSTVSRHLRILSREGWLSSRSEGTKRHYRLSPSLEPAAEFLWEAVRGDLAQAPSVEEDRARARSVREVRAARSRAFFSTAAEGWDHLRGELFGEEVDLQLLPGLLNPSDDVGDLGCGTGRLARVIAPFAGTVVAVDRSAEMLKVARTRLEGFENVAVREAEIEALPMGDRALDVAILSLVLHYVVDPGTALAEVGRVLRPGGRVLILDMVRHQRTAFREEMGHVWLGFTEEELSDWLRGAGFGAPTIARPPVYAGATGPLLFSLAATRN